MVNALLLAARSAAWGVVHTIMNSVVIILSSTATIIRNFVTIIRSFCTILSSIIPTTTKQHCAQASAIAARK